jgi:hypothetical protein
VVIVGIGIPSRVGGGQSGSIKIAQDRSNCAGAPQDRPPHRLSALDPTGCEPRLRRGSPQGARRCLIIGRVGWAGSTAATPHTSSLLWGSRMRTCRYSDDRCHHRPGMIVTVLLRLLYLIFQHVLGLLLLMGSHPPNATKPGKSSTPACLHSKTPDAAAGPRVRRGRCVG